MCTIYGESLSAQTHNQITSRTDGHILRNTPNKVTENMENCHIKDLYIYSSTLVGVATGSQLSELQNGSYMTSLIRSNSHQSENARNICIYNMMKHTHYMVARFYSAIYPITDYVQMRQQIT